MDSGPEIEAHHHHHTGHRWLDITLGVAAILISLVSLVVGLHHGQTMEKMVEASTWPYVDFAVSHANPDGSPKAALMLVNSGIGPARIETFEVFYDGKPVANNRALIIAAVGAQVSVNTITSTASDRVIPANSQIEFLSVLPGKETEGDFMRFRSSLGKVSAHVCYCSALDECWIRDSDKPKPDHVKQCPKPAVPFEG